MTIEDRRRWDAKYAERALPEALRPDEWLAENVAGLRPGRALDLACGMGTNALWLARTGWRVEAIDVSPVGLSRARALAERHGCPVHWIAADLDDFPLPPETYDLVVVFRFLERRRIPAMIESTLRPGGLLLYETFAAGQLERADNHLKNPAYALAAGELPNLFPGLIVRRYREDRLAERTVARLAGEKPAGAD